MVSRSVRRVVAVSLASVAVLSAARLAWAHARLTRSDPAAGAQLTVAPRRIRLWFSERPERAFTRVLLSRDSTPIADALGPVRLIAGDSAGVECDVTSKLAAGAYLIEWRTAASDGHATSGRIAFAVVTEAAEPAATPELAPMAAAHRDETPTGFAFAERWAELLFLLIAIGGVA